MHGHEPKPPISGSLPFDAETQETMYNLKSLKPLEPEDYDKARRIVNAQAIDEDDRRELLDMLGL